MIDYSPFRNDVDFYKWVSITGTDVKDICKNRIEECILNGKCVKALDIFDQLQRDTRQIDRSLVPIQVKFS
jgi:hypothetical protein